MLAADRVSVRRCGIGELRAGDVIVLSVSDGLYDELGWGAKARVHVEDTSIDRWPGLMLDQAFIAHWLDHVPDELAKVVDALDDETNDGDPGPLIDALLGALRTSTPKHSEAEWQHLVSRLAA